MLLFILYINAINHNHSLDYHHHSHHDHYYQESTRHHHYIPPTPPPRTHHRNIWASHQIWVQDRYLRPVKLLHPGKLAWNLKHSGWETTFLWGRPIFRVNISKHLLWGEPHYMISFHDNWPSNSAAKHPYTQDQRNLQTCSIGTNPR